MLIHYVKRLFRRALYTCVPDTIDTQAEEPPLFFIFRGVEDTHFREVAFDLTSSEVNI